MLIRHLLILLSMFTLLVACSAEPIIPSTPTASATPAPTATATLTPSPTITPTPGPTTAHILSDGSGDYATLEIAIESVAAESTLILGEGIFYLEGLLEINKPLTLVGSGHDKTIVEGEGPWAVVHYTGAGRLTIRDIAFLREGELAAVVMVIQSGEVDFSNCRFSNGASNEDGSIPGNGLVFLGDSSGIVKDCEIDGNAKHGVSIHNQANPELSGNDIHHNRDNGIVVNGRAKPALISNHIHNNRGIGIAFSLEEDGGLASSNLLERNSLQGFFTGTDIIVFNDFRPELVSNNCSYEQRRSRNNDPGDFRGILFLMSLTSLQDMALSSASPIVRGNNCAVAWCSLPTFFYEMTCRNIR